MRQAELSRTTLKRNSHADESDTPHSHKITVQLLRQFLINWNWTVCVHACVYACDLLLNHTILFLCCHTCYSHCVAALINHGLIAMKSVRPNAQQIYEHESAISLRMCARCAVNVLSAYGALKYWTWPWIVFYAPTFEICQFLQLCLPSCLFWVANIFSFCFSTIRKCSKIKEALTEKIYI